MAEKAIREMTVSNKYKNPFIGLRSFSGEEQHLYFGREEHSDVVVKKLLKNKFLAVTGASGLGKSSFVNCGVIPQIINHGDWTVIKTQPGRHPLEELFRKVHAVSGNVTDEGVPKDIESRKAGILNNLKSTWKKKNSSFIIFIDHFEQLFQTPVQGKIDSEVVDAYISLILNLLQQSEVPVFIIISLRSDYIGECSQFSEFTGILNSSSYLLPRMGKEELRKAIEGPLKVTGCDWDQRLVERISNDLKDRHDQLPVLQHVLMRSFEAWKDPDLARKPLSVFAYENVGGAANALSLHAEELYNELDDSLKGACERVFKVIARKTQDNKEICQPAKISEIAAITQYDAEQIQKVVKVFNRKDRTFITPDQSVELNYDSFINLAHESLIRNWKRLSEWVDEEAESVKMYLDLAEAAAKFQLGKTNLWVPPQLDLALEWKEKNNPNLAWARRYNPAYERTMVFLDLSENEYLQDQDNKTRGDRIRLIRSRIISIVSSVAAIFLLFVYFNRDKSTNTNDYIPVETENTLAQNITEESAAMDQDDPVMEEDFSEQGTPIVQDNLQEEVQEPVRTTQNRQSSTSGRETTTNQAAITPSTTTRESQRSENTTTRRNTQTTPVTTRNERTSTRNDESQNQAVNTSREQNITEETPAETSAPAVSKEQAVNAIASMTEGSFGASGDADLKALLAYQAYKFNNEYNSGSFSADIYSALYQSMKAHLGETYNAYKGHSNAVRTLDFLPGSSTFFSAGSDGKILRWDLDSQKKDPVTIVSGRGIIEKLKVTNNGSWLLIGESRSGMYLLDLRTPGKSPEAFKVADPNIRAIALAKDNNTFYTAGLQNFIEKHSINRRNSEKVIETGSRINSLAISPDGNSLVGG
ncbi:MAG: WD40 repeat domain-containing protein, partial [Bacteroidales bacterium]